MKEEIKIKVTTEHIQCLLEGKKLTIQNTQHPTIHLIPERYGVFMTYEKLEELRRKVFFNIMTDPDTAMKELFGNEIYEKITEYKTVK